MALSPGTRLGPYEVVAPIGAGGMGEVYRARDPRLGREVAIKVLAPHLAQDRDALARFEREAKTASALNHPHIVHIYEIGEASTASGPVHYIAMELVEGETLRARLKAGTRLPALLEPLAQAADALAKAHKAGIVHRDLKPDNVMITADGYPKVLDFGLAKLHEPINRARDTESDPTAELAGHTRTGTILGTPGYMSPEQVQGRPADHRSDVFSFGCILYEAATGRQPFRGDSSVATLHAIVYDEPASVESLNPTTSEKLRGIIRRCLEKAPEQRYQSIKEVADEIRAAARSGTTASPDALSTRVLPGPVARRAGLWLAAGGIAIVAVIGGLMFARMQERRKSEASSAPRAAIQIEKLTSRGDIERPTVSPDGRHLAYTTSETPLTIWLRDLVEKTEARLVTLPAAERVTSIRFARDGRSIYYSVTEKNTTSNSRYRKPLIGGEPRLVPPGTLSPDERRTAFGRVRDGKWILFVAELEDSTEKEVGEADRRGALAWSPDGSQLMFTRLKDAKHTVFVVKSDGSEERKVGELAQPIEGAWWKPDASAALLSVYAADKMVQLIDLDLASGATRPLGKGTWRALGNVRWLPDNSGIVFTAQTERPEIWHMPYPGGEAKRVPVGTAAYTGLGMTADGTRLVALQTSERSDLLVSSNPEAGIYKKVVSGTDVEYSLCWTPDDQIVYASNEAGSSDLYVSDPDGARRKQLTFDRKANETAPAASPDGRYVVFASDRSGRLGIQRINADGTGLLSLTSPTTGRGDHAPYVTPDSRWVFYRGWDNGPTLWKLPIDGGTPTLVVGNRSDAREEKAYGASASPDRTSLAFFYFTLERPRREFSPTRIAISTMEGRILRELPYASPLSLVGDHHRVQWSRDGSTLYYVQVGNPDNLWKRPVSGGPPVQVTHFEDRLVDFEWSKDGKLLACSRQSQVSDAVLITNFR